MGSSASKKTAQAINANNSAGKNPTTSQPDNKEKQIPPTDEKIAASKENLDKKTENQSSVKEQENNSEESETADDKAKLDQSTAKAGENKMDTSLDKKTGNQVLDNTESTKQGDSKISKTEVNKTETEERIIQEEPKDQRNFDMALKLACVLLKPDSLLKTVTKNVAKLHLSRALPLHFSLHKLLSKFENLKDLDLSNNNLGPQAFRAVCLAMCNNSTILSLNMAGNKSDTDSAESLGRMLTENQSLQYLDVSSNYLGKDYFSRQVGQALKVNTTLKTLRCEGIGTTDARVFIEALQENSSLTEIDFSSNDVSDKLGFAKGLTESLRKPSCCLCCVSLSRCGINAAGMAQIMKGLSENQSLTELNLNGSEFASLGSLISFIVTAAKHPHLVTLSLDSCSVKSQDVTTGCSLHTLVDVMKHSEHLAYLFSLVWYSPLVVCKENASQMPHTASKNPGQAMRLCDLIRVLANQTCDSTSCDSVSSLEVLSLTNCNLSDAFVLELTKYAQGKLLTLTEIDLAANDGLSPVCLDQLVKMTSDEDSPCCLRKLKYGLNKADGVTEKLCLFPSLHYLNLRNCHVSAADVGSLGKLLGNTDCQLSTVVLEGLKLSGTQALKELLENARVGHLSALSLGGCSLDDNDLSPLCESIKAGLQLQMLKLSANRITDVGVAAVVEAVLKSKSHPLGVLDLSNNRIEDNGAKSLVKLLSGKSKLHSLNVSYNNIGKEGLLALVSAVGGKSPLCTLYTQGQSIKLDEGHIVEVFSKLSTSLGFKIQRTGDNINSGYCDLPSNLPEGLVVNLTNLGGNSGDVGQAIDCPAILTDYTQDRLPSLSFSHTMEICSYLKGTGESHCVWSDQEWSRITGADRPTTETPSWLKISTQRDLALYLSNLGGTTTQQKIEALLEMEADCNLDEVVLMKDPVTRSINGTGWAVMVDRESVQKAIDYFNSGEAKIFGQAFMISRLNVHVDDTANAEVERKAQEDRVLRLKLRQAEEAAHRTLIINTAEATWKRHAYRLAHPAYADGRIW